MKQDSRVRISSYLVSCALICGFGIPQANAELRAIDDAELSQYTGQAAIAFDVTEAGTNRQTRFTMGLDTAVQMNIDNVVLGEYNNASSSTSSDIQVSNLSLGHISTDGVNPQLDGNIYSEGQIVPFEGVNPYFEISQDNGELVGFRLGFEQARGTLSGDFSSLSGNIGLKIDDGSGTLKDAKLLDSAGAATDYRATHIGLDDGTNFTELTNIKTLEIGEKQTDGTVAYANDLFFSFQKQNVQWESVGGSTPTTANAGVYMNIPTAMQLDLQQLQTGVSRARTEYIDRGNGLF